MFLTLTLNPNLKYNPKADLHEFWDVFCEGITCGKGDPNTKGDGVTGLLSGVEA